MPKINQKIIKEAEKHVMSLAKKSPLDWFFELHQREIISSAKKLLKKYPSADSKIVLLSCWLHDLGHLKAKTLEEVNIVKPNHYETGATMARDFLSKYDLPAENVEKVINCILCHRGSRPHIPKTLEEKIVAVADTLSHYESIFYLFYFKIYPKDSLDEFVKSNSAKMERDWRDLALLPEARAIAGERFRVIMEMLGNYKKLKENYETDL